VVTFQNLIPNAEYSLIAGIVGTDAVLPVFTAPTGLTKKSSLEIENVTFGVTFIATAEQGTYTITWSGAVASPVILAVTQIPASSL
jgi:hypothetical protein